MPDDVPTDHAQTQAAGWHYYEYEGAMYRVAGIDPCSEQYWILGLDGEWRRSAGPSWYALWMDPREAYEHALAVLGEEQRALVALSLNEPPPEPPRRRAPGGVVWETHSQVQRTLPGASVPEIWAEVNRRLAEAGY